jgi:type I restriction enzyme, S subunit
MTNIDTETEYEALPVGWKKCPLGEIANTQLGKMLNSSKQTGLTEMPYVRNINLRWGSIDLSDIKSMDVFEEEKEKFTLLLGDVLVCEGGEPGRAAVWNSDLEMAFQNAIHRVRPFNTCSSPFLCYQFEWLTKNGRLEQFFTGVTIKHFSQQKLRKATFNVPPLLEQHQIVEILEEQLGRLDAALENVCVVKEKAAQFRRSLLHSAFNGTLTGHTPKEGTLPEGWEEHPLSDSIKSIRENASLHDTTTYELWSVPSFKTGQPEIVQGSSIGSGKLSVQPSDVLISKINPRINRVWIVTKTKENLEQVASTEWLVARIPPEHPLLPEYLKAYATSPIFRALITDGTQGVTGSHTRAKTQQILEFPIPLPSLPEQQQIVEILEEQLGRLDAALAVAESVEARSTELRRSLLHAAFTGRLTEKWREENRSLISKGRE